MRLLVMNGGLCAAFRIAATTGTRAASSVAFAGGAGSSVPARTFPGTANSSSTRLRSSPSRSSSISACAARERSTGSVAFTR